MPYQKEHRSQAEDRAVIKAGKRIVAKTYARPRDAAWSITFLQTFVPPTPLAFATDLAVWFKNYRDVGYDANAMFGVAWQHGLVFEAGNPRGASVAAIGVACL